MQTITLNTPKPDTFQVETEQGKLPARYANHKFVFAHYVGAWDFDEESGFLPQLSQLNMRPGCNGCADVYGPDGLPIKGMVDPSAMLGSVMTKGGIIINPADPRLKQFRGYVSSYPTVGGGKHYCFNVPNVGGVTFEVLPGGNAKIKECPEIFKQFQKFLMDNGLCHELPESIYNMMLDREKTGLARLNKESHSRPHYAEPGGKIDLKKKRIAAMEKAWAKLRGSVQESAVGIQLNPQPATGEIANALQSAA